MVLRLVYYSISDEDENMIYCKDCGFSLVDFELEEMCEHNTPPMCWECAKKDKKEDAA